MRSARGALLWGGLAIAVIAPLVLAAMSPQLAWRQPIYIVAGFAGIVGLGLMLVQPVLMSGLLPDLAPPRARRLHRALGGVLVGAVLVHVVGLWITSPPDVIDALTLQSPTPFSVWGVMAMWGIFAIVGLVMLRRRGMLRPQTWRIAHLLLALVVVGGTAAHALLIEGTMETTSKIGLCALVILATLGVVAGLRHRAR
jgi:predicted ferric reductase